MYQLFWILMSTSLQPKIISILFNNFFFFEIEYILKNFGDFWVMMWRVIFIFIVFWNFLNFENVRGNNIDNSNISHKPFDFSNWWYILFFILSMKKIRMRSWFSPGQQHKEEQCRWNSHSDYLTSSGCTFFHRFNSSACVEWTRIDPHIHFICSLIGLTNLCGKKPLKVKIPGDSPLNLTQSCWLNF